MPKRDILSDPVLYARVGEWGEGSDKQRLYEIVGDARGSYAVYDLAGAIVIFEQPDEALDVYRLDEDRNGIFIVRISRQEVLDGTMDYPGSEGWTVSLEPSDAGGYIAAVYDAEASLVDRRFVFYVRH